MANRLDITDPGLYVIEGKHVIDLQPGLVCSYPDVYTKEKFTDEPAMKVKYPKLEKDPKDDKDIKEEKPK